MKSVTVLKTSLLKILHENREQHISDHQQSVDGWINEINGVLTKAQEKFKAGEDLGSYVQLNQKPESHEKDYDRVIGMLEMSIGSQENLDISAHEYQSYVMDDWDWKEHFINTSNMYKG